MVFMVRCYKDKVDMHQSHSGPPNNRLSFIKDCATKSSFCNLKIEIVFLCFCVTVRIHFLQLKIHLFYNSKLILEFLSVGVIS